AVALAALLMAALASPDAAAGPQQAGAPAAESPFRRDRKPDESDDFFGKGEIPRLKIVVDEGELGRLRDDPRSYVHARLEEDGKTVNPDVALKLKGAAGSFRELDEKPAFTINVDKFDKKQEFHGLDKFHLNNSVQDDTYLHEFVCSTLMAAAGVPAPRITHARVWLNGRDLGLYVLKESFDRKLVKRHFREDKGNLYDGGFCQEIDVGLERDEGEGVPDGSDLRALANACREPDANARWRRIEEQLDVEAFLTLLAMELMIGHWDGYANNANNYRVYFAGKEGRAYFLPHGMDQVFQDAEASILEYPTALVADAVLRNPVWRARFRKRLQELLPVFAIKEKLLPRLKPVMKRVEAAAKTVDGRLPGSLDGAWNDLENRLLAREKSLKEQVKRPEPKTIELDSKGRAKLLGFAPNVEAGDAATTPTTTGGKRAYRIECGREPCAASWRKKVLLPQGKWRFSASVKCDDIAPIDGSSTSGAQLRIGGAERRGGIVGACGFTDVTFDFEVAEAVRLVELIAELNAAGGACWFDVANMRVTKLP
ncbi:MAG: hypothetical protein FJ293_15430, partial [Planctomycetes bacterium]|nr:hypothetical protein [Planctomycetota bacterium]